MGERFGSSYGQVSSRGWESRDLGDGRLGDVRKIDILNHNLPHPLVNLLAIAAANYIAKHGEGHIGELRAMFAWTIRNYDEIATQICAEDPRIYLGDPSLNPWEDKNTLYLDPSRAAEEVPAISATVAWQGVFESMFEEETA